MHLSSRTPPPWTAFRNRLLERAAELAAAGDVSGAAVLRALVETWWRDQVHWNESVQELLQVNHEINNALVGVSGNAQLLLTGESGRHPKHRERLLVVLRESERIERAVHRLQALKDHFESRPNGMSNEHDAQSAA